METEGSVPAATRQASEVESAATAAGLVRGKGPTQLLHFSSCLNAEDIRLLELPPDVLAALREGDRVVVRGDRSEEAVLCTGNRTYEVKMADTSNTLLIVPDLTVPSDPDFQCSDEGTVLHRSREVSACLSAYLELRPCPPKTSKLKQLLSQCPYRGEEFEAKSDPRDEYSEASDPRRVGSKENSTEKARKKNGPNRYTFEELLDCVRASEGELVQALDRLEACLIDGHWCLLELDYRDRVFQFVLTLLEELDLNHRHVPLDLVCSKLEELEPRFAIEHCLRCYGNKTQSDDEGTVYELSEERVCQFFAELLLRPAGKFNYHEFMESWRQSVPDGMTTNLSQLEGLALADRNCMPPVIWHFPVSELPQDPLSRFNKLFNVREKWTHSEILPYIQDLETPGQSLNALLLKHARVSTNAQGQRDRKSVV